MVNIGSSADADEFPEADQWPNLLKLRANFENRKAIYIEKGATRVRVSNIRGSSSCAAVRADIEELPAEGLGVGIYDPGGEKPTPPRRWSIGSAGLPNEMRFSDHDWYSYSQGGTWHLYFHPKVVQEVLELASRLSDKVDGDVRYNRILRLLENHRLSREVSQAVFPAD
jgi:hypothetical protein